MKICFVGPSRGGWEQPVGVELRPPARWGDIARVAMEHRDATIVFADGVMLDAPPPNHVELMAVMSLGVRVYGTASLGALRAADLPGPSGVVGVGRIYGALRRGTLLDDSELCVRMHPVSFRAETVALVHVRAALGRMLRVGAVTEDVAHGSLEVARGLHFLLRHPTVLRESLASAGALSPSALMQFFDTLAAPGSHVKALDVRAALDLALGADTASIERRLAAEAEEYPLFGLEEPG